MELDLKVHLKGGEQAGLWLEDVSSGRMIRLPESALWALAEALREAGEETLAGQVEALHREAVATRRREEAKHRCMDVIYSQDEYRRCLELLREDLEGKG